MIQPITICNFNTQNSNIRNTKVAFTGGSSLAAMDSVLSQQAFKLVKRAGQLIDETWSKVKKKAPMTIPEFVAKKNEKIITMKPVYNFVREAILLEVKNGKYTEKVVLDRVNPNRFRYEKMVKTDNGSATLKSYNSQNGSNYEMIEKVNDLIETYFPKIVSEVPDKKHHRHSI